MVFATRLYTFRASKGLVIYIIGNALFVCDSYRIARVVARYGYDGNIRNKPVGVHIVENVETAHFGHYQIEQNYRDIRLIALYFLYCRSAAVRFFDVVFAF